MKYYSVVNKTGLAKLSSAMALGMTINLSTMAIGDGAGPTNIIIPTDTKNALAREVYRAPIVSLQAEDPERPGLLTATMIVPPDKGGWNITEGIIYCDDGTPFANGALTPGYKSTQAEGGIGEYIVEFVFEISNIESAAVQLIVNPYLTIATRQWVTTSFVTKSDLALAIAEVKANFERPPFIERPGVIPEAGPVFIDGTGNYQLKVAQENSLLEITVLGAEPPPTLSAPGTEKIRTVKGDHALIRLITKNRLYRFKRQNNQWRQL
jgi:Phage tail-collar fibre protein